MAVADDIQAIGQDLNIGLLRGQPVHRQQNLFEFVHLEHLCRGVKTVEKHVRQLIVTVPMREAYPPAESPLEQPMGNRGFAHDVPKANRCNRRDLPPRLPQANRP